MIEGLEPIPLQDLRALGTTKCWSVEGHLDELESVTPVRGTINAEHRGNVLAVEGDLATIVTLTCDRCLGQFNLELSCRPSELIWLGTTPPTDEQLQESEDIEAIDGLVESLDPRGSFNPEQWAFEQLNLQRPVVNHCGEHCPGPGVPLREISDAAEEQTLDPRWAALRRLNES